MVEQSPSASGLRVLSVIIIILSVTATLLRVWSRIVVSNRKFRLNDWLAFIALPLSLAVPAFAIDITYSGFGLSESALGSPSYEYAILRKFNIAAALFDFGGDFARLSVLALYAELFDLPHCKSHAWRFIFYAVFAATVIHPLLATLLFSFPCTPIAKSWNPNVPGHCILTNPSQVPWVIYQVVIDVFILLLPMPELFKLNVKPSKKLLLAATLTIGYSVPLVSIGRLITTIKLSRQLQEDFSYHAVPIVFWGVVEPGVAMVAISLPTIFLLLRRGWRFGGSALLHPGDVTELERARARPRSMQKESGNRSQLRNVLRQHGAYVPRIYRATGLTSVENTQRSEGEEDGSDANRDFSLTETELGGDSGGLSTGQIIVKTKVRVHYEDEA